MSVESFSKDALTASALPVDSALTIIFKVCFSPSLAKLYKSSKLAALVAFLFLLSLINLRLLAISLASLSIEKAMNLSPALGTSDKPITETGVLGEASFKIFLNSLVILRALPYEVPTTK